MKQRISAFLATQNGKLVAAVGALVLVWIIILISYSDGLGSLFPDESDISDLKREIVRQRRSHEKALADKKQADKLYEDYKLVINGAWREEQHGMIDTEFRRMVSQAARSVELTLDSLGSVKTSRINADFYYAELDVSVRTNFGEVIKFIEAVSKITPRVTWRRIDMRPDRRGHWGRHNNDQGSIAARVLGDENASRTTSRIGFNGTLRVIGFDGKVVPRKNTVRGGRK